jgi:ketosteroid isomerase-like protein
VTLWLADWLEAWESLVNSSVDYRDLGDWVLVRLDTQARGRDGVAVNMRRFLLYQVRDGKVAVYRSFGTEQEALKAVELEE